MKMTREDFFKHIASMMCEGETLKCENGTYTLSNNFMGYKLAEWDEDFEEFKTY